MKDKSTLVIVLLAVVALFSIGSSVFMFTRYEKLEDRYDRILEKKLDKYDDDEDDVIFDDDKDYDKDDDKDYDKDDDKEDISNNDKTTKKKTTTAKYISKSKALSIALKNMKLSESDVYDIDIEFENKTVHGNNVYEVTFDYKNHEYEYFVDGKTGKILASFKSID